MSLEKAHMPLTVKQIAIMDKAEKFDFNHIVQRGLVWEHSRKSALIESLILGYPVPPLYCRRDRDELTPNKKGTSHYVVMDGKQRITTVASFYRNEWALADLPSITYTTFAEEIKTVNISGKTFEELPEEIQDMIKDTSFTFICFENITPEEERELFKRLNAGKQLSTKARILSNCKDLENILEIGQHSLFAEMLTEKALSHKNHVTIIMKFWTMLYKNIRDISFEGRYFNPQVEETTIEPEQKNSLIEIFEYIQEVHDYILSIDKSKEIKKSAKKFYTETHLVSFIPFIKFAIDDEITVDNFGNWVVEFFATDANSSEYLEASLRGSAKNENIQIRHNVLTHSWDKFFKEA